MNLPSIGPTSCFRPPLISKGLRQHEPAEYRAHVLFQATPDFKGIKTISSFLSNPSSVSGHP